MIAIVCMSKKDDIAPENVYMHASWSEYYEDMDDLSAESDVIAVIEVKGIQKQYLVGNIPMTNFSAVVTNPIHGVDNSEEIVIVQTGGIVDNQLIQIADDPLMKEGEQYLIFGEINDLGTITILGGPQGRYSYSNGKITNMFTAEINQLTIESPNFLSSNLNLVNQNMEAAIAGINN